MFIGTRRQKPTLKTFAQSSTRIAADMKKATTQMIKRAVRSE